MEDFNPSACNLRVLESLSEASVREIAASYDDFCAAVVAILDGDLSAEAAVASSIRALSKYGLRSFLQDHFLGSLEERFEKNGATEFWRCFDGLKDETVSGRGEVPAYEKEVGRILCVALEGISLLKQYQEKCLLLFVNALEYRKEECLPEEKSDVAAERAYLFSRYQLMVSSVLMAGLPCHFPEILHRYFKSRLEELSSLVDRDLDSENNEECQDEDEMDLDEQGRTPSKSRDMNADERTYQVKLSEDNRLVKNIGNIVRELGSLGLTSMTEAAYASAIFLLLKAKVYDLAGEDYRISVLQSVKGWIQAVPLPFLQALLTYLGDSVSSASPPDLSSPLACRPPSCSPRINIYSEGLIRWKLRLEYFAYETLQDLRIAKLFEIIVDYPDSSPAIEDLKQCLEYTGQHSKLVESFISSLRYRLLTAGASTNDILHQYVSTIKALRTIDPAGIFLEAVGEPIREYLRGRKDTIKCIVTMLTDGNGGNPNASGITGDSLLEELNREEESQEIAGDDDDFHGDEKQAWINALRWEPDPVEADPMKGGRNQRKVDVLGMIVSIIGSKDQLVNEYRVVLAEKLLNKSDYDIDSEIHSLELLKIHFGESSMQRCEIMLNDVIDSKRTNQNIKATIKQSHSGTELQESGLSLDNFNATIISSNFWPSIQDEAIALPQPVEQLLTDYAHRFHQIKTPRKLLWKKNLGTVKLELQFEDRAMELTVAPIHAAIIMQFQDQSSWSSNKLAAAIGVPVDVLNRRMGFWISKGIIVDTTGTHSDDRIFTLVEGVANTTKNGNSESCEDPLGGDEDGDSSVASVEEHLRKEMTVYEKFIMGMLTNFGSMTLDRIHNTLKMFCVADPPYDKSIQQLQSFLSGLVSEEKLELRDGMYLLKK